MAGAYPRHPVGLPVQLLPFDARLELANLFDGDYNRFMLLASYLGFSGVADSIMMRGFQGVQNSATLKLLEECQQNGLTIQHLHNALCRINHSAVQIIHQWMPYIESEYRAMVQSRMYPGNGQYGQQNSCMCNSCHRPPVSRQRSFDPPRSNSDKYKRQSSEPNNEWEPPNETDTEHMPSSGQGLNYSVSYNGRHVGGAINVPNVSGRENQNDVPQIDNKTIQCNCQKCRLKSDPNETQLMEYRDSEKESCLVSQMDMLGIADDKRQIRRVPSNEQDTEARPNSNKICANSTIGVHFVGVKPEECPICRSPSLNLRHSWHGSNNGLESTGSVRDSSSDISLNKAVQSTTVINRLSGFHSIAREGADNDLNANRNIHRSLSVNNSGTNNMSVALGHSERNGESPPTSVNDQQGSSNIGASGNREPIPPISREDQPIVFITYSPHNNAHLLEIKTLIGVLQEAGIRVKIDMDTDCFDELRLNRNEWLDRSVDNARYVIVCISPTYTADVRDTGSANSPSPRTSQLNAHYIYDRLRTEYINNLSQNKRMLPVLFPNSGAQYQAHVPHFMQPTLVYTFPGQARGIIGRILGRETQLPYV